MGMSRNTSSCNLDKMIDTKTVCEMNMCAGCAACVEVCPKHAIHIEDTLDAYNAVIDESICINCNACHQVCQHNYSVKAMRPQKWYQAWANETNVRNRGASGGVATALSLTFIQRHGSVCSCAFEQGKFKFHIAETVDELGRMAGSKYVKSSPEGVYKALCKKLSNGHEVLFIGLPCQVAAIKNFVGKELLTNLYTVDLICHGTPTPQFLRMFLDQYGYDLDKIEDIRFRKKNHFQVYISDIGEGGYKSVEMDGVADYYTIAFLSGVFYTENCYHCSYAKNERVGDITLGDSWGSDLDDREQRKGLSLVLCQTEKGSKLVKQSNLQLREVDFEKAVSSNHQLSAPTKRPNKRDAFLADAKAGKSFNLLVKKHFPAQYGKQLLKRILLKTHIMHARADCPPK